MTREDYFKFHREFCDRMIEITAAKNHDYAGFGDDDPFANFTVVERCGVSSTEQGFLTRMMDKISRINSFVKQGVLNVKDESIQDTLQDLANYAALMAGYIKSKKDRQAPNDACVQSPPFKDMGERVCTHPNAHHFHDNAPRYCPDCDKFLE